MAVDDPNKIKICLFGDAGVGKSAITLRYISGEFEDEYDPTLEDRYRGSVTCENKMYVLEILDTAGADAYTDLRPTYFYENEGFLFIYNMMVKESVEFVKKVHLELSRAKEQVPFAVLIFGNKLDLVTPSTPKQVSTDSGQHLATEFKADFLEGSALSGHNIREGFELLSRQVIAKRTASKKPGKKQSLCVLS